MKSSNGRLISTSLGMRDAQTRMYVAGSFSRTVSSAALPCCSKSSARAFMKSPWSLFREPLGRPPGLALLPGLKSHGFASWIDSFDDSCVCCGASLMRP